MRLALVLCFTCAGCDVLFQLDHVPAPGSVTTDAGSDAETGSDVPNLVFVSSMKVAPGTLGGVAAADALCTSLATAAGIPGHYVAWLGSSAATAPSHLGATARGWVRPDGRPFADTVVDIVQQHVWYPLRLTEAGDDVATSNDPSDLVVATGTELNGSTSIYTCSDYTSPSAAVSSGLADDAPFGWDTNMGGACATPARLYCFGVDHVAPVALVPASTRLAFVTAYDLLATAGVAGFDQQCAVEAAAANLPGTYRAAVATTSGSALSRFAPGAPWVRIDGVTTIDSSGAIMAPLEEDADGMVDGPTVAWSGSPSLSTKAATLAASCGDWTASTSTQGLTGNDTRSGTDAFGGIPNPCNNMLRVYCLQD
jgi:hypothetical protein